MFAKILLLLRNTVRLYSRQSNGVCCGKPIGSIMAEVASRDKCFRSTLYKECSPLKVGVKPYIPGVTISREHSFVEKLDNWKISYGKVPKSEITAEIVRAHPGNPLAVIEGDDDIDYVLHDKGEGGKHFSNARARQLADCYLCDLGEGLAAMGTGLPENYWKDYIFKPNDGSLLQYKFDKEEYELEYSRQRSAKLARDQLPKDIKGKTSEEVIEEVMKSSMVIGTIRETFGYYELSTNDRFERITERVLGDMFAADTNSLSGTKEIALSPVFIKNILRPEIIPKPAGSSLTVSTKFDYGFGKLFNKDNIRTTKGCNLSKFSKGLNVPCFRRVGLASQSYIGLGGTFVLDRSELQEREQLLQSNQEFHRERLQKAGKQVYDRRQTYAVGDLDLDRGSFTGQATEKTSPAHFLLYLKTKLDHRTVLPFVLQSEMFKSELVMVLTLLRIIDAQTRSKWCSRYEKGPLEIGERTTIVYQRFVETWFPCKSWWGDGTIVSGAKYKMTTMSLFSFRRTKLTLSISDVSRALKIDDQDKETREAKILEQIKEREKACDGKHYMFIPVMESKSLVFTKEDSVFVNNNVGKIMSEVDVSRLFGLRDARKGRFPTTVASAVVSVGAFEMTGKTSQGGLGPSRVRMTADLQQPCAPLLKAETIRIFCVGDNDEEDEPDHATKIQGYLDALKIRAARQDNTSLTSENIEKYLEDMDLSEEEQDDIICLLIKEKEAEMGDQSENEASDAGRWKDRTDVHTLDEEDAPLAKRARCTDNDEN